MLRAMLLLFSALYLGFLFVALFLSDSMIFLPHPSSYKDSAEILKITTAGGKKIFGQRCAECHGAEARGTDRAPDLTADDLQQQSDGALFWKISSGNTRAGMPSFSFLPEAQRWQLVLSLRAC